MHALPVLVWRQSLDQIAGAAQNTAKLQKKFPHVGSAPIAGTYKQTGGLSRPFVETTGANYCDWIGRYTL